MSADLGAIKRKLGPRKRHVNLNIQAAKEVKQRPIESDLDSVSISNNYWMTLARKGISYNNT